MVSDAFFQERDFSQVNNQYLRIFPIKHFEVSILRELHEQVNISVIGWADELCLADLSARELLLSFRHRTLLLFKVLVRILKIFEPLPCKKIVEFPGSYLKSF